MSTPGWLVAKPIAHRGLHNKANGIIENTLSAAEAAIAHGFPIECDVQLTADGEAVVFHDFDLARLTAADGPGGRSQARGSHRHRHHRLDQGRQDPVVAGFSSSQIAKRVPLVIEIKSKFDGDLRLTKRVCEVLCRLSRPVRREVLRSGHRRSACATLAPNISRGIIAELNYASKTDSIPERRS